MNRRTAFAACIFLAVALPTVADDTSVDELAEAMERMASHVGAGAATVSKATDTCTDTPCMLRHLSQACRSYRLALDAMPDQLRRLYLGMSMREVVDHCTEAEDALRRGAGSEAIRYLLLMGASLEKLRTESDELAKALD